MNHPKKLFLNNRNEEIKHELKIQNSDIKAHHREEKFEKMSLNPYAFYRGSNHLYWEDFYNDWRVNRFGGGASTLTWINGDAHIYNYGAYANHEGELIFCMDDFDDSVVADYQFDLWRMAVSIVLDCRENRVFDRSAMKKALLKFSQAYRTEMMTETGDESSDFHLTKDTATGIMKKFLKKVSKKKSRLKMLDKWTKEEKGQRIFDLDNPKLQKLSAKDYAQIEKLMGAYVSSINHEPKKDESHFLIKDIAKRIKSGTGSLGSERFYVLIEGDTDALDDDVILDVKEQGKAPVYGHMSKEEQDEYDQIFPNDGERHALAFRALAEHPDQYLGWFSKGDKSFSVKERSPFKADFPTEKLETKPQLYFMADLWGKVLAGRHKRASIVLNNGDDEMPRAFKELVSGHEEGFDDMVKAIALNYADQVKRDYDCFLEIV